MMDPFDTTGYIGPIKDPITKLKEIHGVSEKTNDYIRMIIFNLSNLQKLQMLLNLSNFNKAIQYLILETFFDITYRENNRNMIIIFMEFLKEIVEKENQDLISFIKDKNIIPGLFAHYVFKAEDLHTVNCFAIRDHEEFNFMHQTNKKIKQTFGRSIESLVYFQKDGKTPRSS